jgi:hypothetical protein
LLKIQQMKKYGSLQVQLQGFGQLISNPFINMLKRDEDDICFVIFNTNAIRIWTTHINLSMVVMKK